MTTLTSNTGFIGDDAGKTLIGQKGKAHIEEVFPDGSAKVTITEAFDSEIPPYTWKIEGTTPHPFAGTPILNMLNGGEIVHSDLNAIITGPGLGAFAS